MKKLMTIALAAVLMFAVASQAQAAVALETSAELRARAFYLDSYTGYVAGNGKSTEFWDQRLRLWMNWQVSETVKLQARADILEGFWGDNATVTNTTVVEDSAGGHTVASTTSGVASKPSIDFDWANMTFVWPNTPLTFQIGRQDASWGPGIISKSDNRDRFKVTAAFDFGKIVALYQKRKEVLKEHNVGGLDDNRQYAVAFVGKGGGFDFGVIELLTQFEADPTVDTEHFITGAYLMGKAGPVDLAVEAAYLTGKNDYAAKADVDLTGLGALVNLSIPAGPVKVGLDVAYAQGDKDGEGGGENKGAFSLDYHAPFTSVVLFSNLDVNGYAGETNLSANTGVKNALAAKLSVGAQPLAGLSLNAAAIWAQRDKVASGSKDMGTEFDLVASYAITPNVTWTLGAGYLLVGDYYKAAGKEADDALAAMSNFTLKF